MGGHFKATTAHLTRAKTEERDRSIAETVSHWINVRNLFYMSERETSGGIPTGWVVRRPTLYSGTSGLSSIAGFLPGHCGI
jgi:hypothetical protein